MISYPMKNKRSLSVDIAKGVSINCNSIRTYQFPISNRVISKY